ncbi:MAG: 23S rRNA (adenine(2503)-C(2))-methyltransferase RlmN [Solirubrobacteraceae bacterium]
MDVNKLEQILADRGQPRFRARQVWAWAARGVSGYEEMTDIPAALREELERELPFSSLALSEEAHSSDGTVKALFATPDGRPLEAVLMRFKDGRRSICVSSQSGCPLTCSFCATGAMRFARNLSSSEILDQALHFRRIEAIDHCVFMGMGEPMLNLDAVLAACERLPDLGVTHRRTTISTVGWIPGIERLAESDMPLRLALSLHAADEALRTELMPVNERYPLADVLEACHAFYERKRRRIFIEYVMLAGVNDRYEQALQLARALTRGGRQGGARSRPSQPIFKVNLIPYNPSDAEGNAIAGDASSGGLGERAAGQARFEGSSRESIAAFRAALEAQGVPVTVRLTRGRDIAAACGQLAARAAA